MKKVIILFLVSAMLVTTSVQVAAVTMKTTIVEDLFAMSNASYRTSANKTVYPTYNNWAMTSPDRTGDVSAWIDYKIDNETLCLSTNNYGVTGTRTIGQQASVDGKYFTEFDLKIDLAATNITTIAYQFQMFLDSNTSSPFLRIGAARNNDKIALVLKQSVSNGDIVLIEDVNATDFYKIKIETDLTTKKNTISINNAAAKTGNFYPYGDSSISNNNYIVAANMNLAKEAAARQVWIDNFKVEANIQIDSGVAATQDAEAIILSNSNFITENFALPSVGSLYGSDIRWISNHPAIEIDSDGYSAIIHRPEFEAGDVQVTLTAIVNCEGAEVQKTFLVKVLKMPSVYEMLNEDLNDIIISNINAILDNFTLPKQGALHGSAISWLVESNPNLTISESTDHYLVTINRPEFEAGDYRFTLTATASYQGKSAQKIFTGTIIKKPQVLTELQKFQIDAEKINLGNISNVNYNFTLPKASYIYQTPIVWSCSDTDVSINDSGTYYTVSIGNIQADKSIVLTANVGGSVMKSFTVMLKKQQITETRKAIVSDTFDGGYYINPGDLISKADNPIQLAEWYMINPNDRPFTNLYFNIDTEGNNGVLRFGRANKNYYSIESFRSFGTAKNNIVTIEAKLKIDMANINSANDLIIGDIELYGKNLANTDVMINRISKVYNQPNLISTTSVNRIDGRVENNDANGNSVVLENLSNDVWYNLRYEVNTKTQRADIYINDSKVIEQIAFLNPAFSVSKLRFVIPNSKRFDGDTGGLGGYAIDAFTVSEYTAATDALEMDKQLLTLPTEVSGNIILPLIGQYHSSQITWESDKPEIMNSIGAVYRPFSHQNDETVMLTATLTLKDAVSGEVRTSQKQFPIVIKKMSSNHEMAIQDADGIQVDSVIYNDIVLPVSGIFNSSDIVWQSSNEGAIAKSGIVTRKSEDQLVTMTAVITSRADIYSDPYSTTKVYTVVVKKRIAESSIPSADNGFAATLPDYWSFALENGNKIALESGAMVFKGGINNYAVREIQNTQGELNTAFEIEPINGEISIEYVSKNGIVPLKLWVSNNNFLIFDTVTNAKKELAVTNDISKQKLVVVLDFRANKAVVYRNEIQLAEIPMKAISSPITHIKFGCSSDSSNVLLHSAEFTPTYNYELEQDAKKIAINTTTPITDNFTLQEIGQIYGSSIVWISSKPSIVTIANGSAIISRPSGGVNSVVTLYATLTYKGMSKEFKFDVTIKAQESVSYSPGGGSGSKGTSTMPNIPNNTDTAEENASFFSDLKDAAWAIPYIEYLYKNGIVSGRGNGQFAPNSNITRAEFVKLLVQIYGFQFEQNTTFFDVHEDDWYYKYISIAQQNKIIDGQSDNTFAPNDNITRQDMAVMAMRALKKAQQAITGTQNAEKFMDDADIAEYAKQSVYEMKGAGIINGFDDNTFAPNANATRAQSAKIIYMLIGK